VGSGGLLPVFPNVIDLRIQKMGSTIILSDEQLQAIYTWVDEVPLSRAKRNITRDFSDGVLMAEVLHHYFPKTVDIKNYSNANSVRQKLYNWQTLNNKVCVFI